MLHRAGLGVDRHSDFRPCDGHRCRSTDRLNCAINRVAPFGALSRQRWCLSPPV